MTSYYLAVDSSFRIKLNSCLVNLGVSVSILGIYGSLQFFLRELFVGISLGAAPSCLFQSKANAIRIIRRRVGLLRARGVPLGPSD
ncbi:hypothetical protein CH378_15050 [Leptospira kmetyi]|uniref:Uncharacterized protein n=1 Tax=Leptospira kmetyi TaxID=408139 RepID=A0ABX4N6E5_9LEPT|nr:hypothetical protein CH378_15050 [Leptospira kmetyi]